MTGENRGRQGSDYQAGGHRSGLLGRRIRRKTGEEEAAMKRDGL